MAKILAPVSMKDPIVDLKTGNVTPYFQRLLQDISDARIASSLADALGGDPGADMIVIWDDTLNTFSFKTVSETLDWLGSEAQGDILYRGFDGWVLLPAGTDGDVLTTHGASANPTWETPSAGGGSEWTLIGTGQTSTGLYDFAVDGAKANIDFTNLTGYQDLLLWMDLVSKASSGGFQVQVSVDNGSTWYTTSGDYVQISANGTYTNAISAGFHNTAATLARTSYMHGYMMGVATVPKHFYCPPVAISTRFLASTSPVNALRFSGSAGGNITGGKVWVFAK